MTTNDQKHDAVYARYSSNQQQETSIEVQIEQCEKAAGHPLVHYIDRASTGRSMARPELLRLLADAQAGKIARLYTYKYDRLGRAAEVHVLVDDLEACGVQLISATDEGDGLARSIQIAVAQDYSRVLSERTRAGMRKSFEHGNWAGGTPMFGYILNDQKHLIVNQQEAAIIRGMVRDYLGSSLGFKGIAKSLQKKGVATRRGRPWCYTTVRSIITNPILVGRVGFCRRCWKLDKRTGKRNPKINDQQAQQVRVDESLRIISDRDFQKVEKQIAKNHKGVTRRVSRPFTGLLYCGCCGHVYHAHRSHNSKGTYNYYHCGTRSLRGAAACSDSVPVREDMLMAQVRDALAACFANTSRIMGMAIARAKEIIGVNRSESARLRAEIERLETELAKLQPLLIDPDVLAEPMARKSIMRRCGEMEAKRDQLQLALAGVTEDGRQSVEALVGTWEQAFQDVRDRFEGVQSPEELNRFLEEVVGPIVVGRDGELAQQAGPGGVPGPHLVRDIAGAGFAPATSRL